MTITLLPLPPSLSHYHCSVQCGGSMVVMVSFTLSPQSLYTPIVQQAVLLSNKASAQAFISFVKTPAMLEIIRGFGYGTAYAE